MSTYRQAIDSSLRNRLAMIEQDALEADLKAYGCATVKGVLNAQGCDDLAALYPNDAWFRRHIHMARHGYGKGEYKYFAYPLPETVGILREEFYRKLVGTANLWNELMKIEARFPDRHQAYLDQCHAAGQIRPTPLLLQYGEGDFNRLHQDVYGDLLFPLQVTVLLSRPEDDFTGGEFVLTEQHSRLQGRAEVVRLEQGDAVVFPVRHRPVQGKKGSYRATMRHGVSRLHSGQRQTLGVIFHDAA